MRISRRTRTAHPTAALADVTIRAAGPADDDALARLAALSETPAPTGDVLLALVGGEARAAIGAGGSVVSDPFRPTAALVELLALRRDQLRQAVATTPRAGSVLRVLRPARRAA